MVGIKVAQVNGLIYAFVFILFKINQYKKLFKINFRILPLHMIIYVILFYIITEKAVYILLLLHISTLQ